VLLRIVGGAFGHGSSGGAGMTRLQRLEVLHGVRILGRVIYRRRREHGC
jgi:hypothetical protein